MLFDYRDLFQLPDGVQTRWASPENRAALKGKAAQAKGGRKGSPCIPLKAGEQQILAEETGVSGTIRRMWMTLDVREPGVLRGIRLDMYWDGAEKPAVSAPLGDFFGTGLGRIAAFESALFSSPEGRSFNCSIPMPFRTGMRIVITNESQTDIGSLFYDIDYTIGDAQTPNTLYFHAHYRRENPTTLRRDYEILPQVFGKGRFIGCNIGVIADKQRYFHSWWGEGECKIYLDGDTGNPTLCGTGTEDYIGTAWGQGRYDHLYQGCHIADRDRMQFCFYRYHIQDPVYFREDIRVTMHQIGCWNTNDKIKFKETDLQIYLPNDVPEVIDFAQIDDINALAPFGLFERQDDWSSCAYFYLDQAANGLPAIDPVEKRLIVF